ncbi:MAG TPA: peptide chain release factor H [Bryobacteraceae bacterium]|nr:peptide chain release factor H [Bryobacteraceae bacterium]
MTHRKREVWLQITAGQGPSECAWAVVRVLEQIRQEALAATLEFKTIEIEPGPQPGTAQSALISISGDAELEGFAASWRGTVQWIARGPFRPGHKRKNWFVGVDVLEPVDEASFDLTQVRWETMRASGPGGQHVNRTESAVRVTHLPTGVHATAMEERSQHRNRKLALARLTKKLSDINSRRQSDAREERWRAHQELSRGNPVRVFRDW